MLAHENLLVVLIGIILGLFIICLTVWYVNRITKEATQDALVRFVIIIFSALVAVWVVDKVVAFRTNLLSEKQSNELFDLIKTLTLMIFSYYFGTKTKNETKT